MNISKEQHPRCPLSSHYQPISTVRQSQNYEEQVWKNMQGQQQQYKAHLHRLSLSAKENKAIQQQIIKYQKLNLEGSTQAKQYTVKQTQVTIVTIYHKNTILKDRQENPQKYTKEWLRTAFLKMAQTVRDLHNENITHNSISIGEVYLSQGQPVLSLPKFRSILRVMKQDYLSLRNQELLAPEVRQGYLCSKSSDVWDLGLVFMHLLQGRLLEDIIQGSDFAQQLEQLIQSVEDCYMKNLIRNLLCCHPESRMTIDKIVEYLQNSKPVLVSQPTRVLNGPLIAEMFPIRPSAVLGTLPEGSFVESWMTLGNGECCSIRDSLGNVFAMLIMIRWREEGKTAVASSMISTLNMNPILKTTVFQTFNELASLLFQNSSFLEINDSGQLILALSEQQLLQRVRFLHTVLYPKMGRLVRNLAVVRNQVFDIYDGLMVDYGLILTAFRATLVPPQFSGLTLTINYRISLEKMVDNVARLYYPISQEESGSEPQFALLQFDRSSTPVRKRYMAVVCNYEQTETFRKVDRLAQDIKFHYQAGDGAVILPYQIHFEGGKFSLRVAPQGVRMGCPLLVVFSHNQCYAIGLFQSPAAGTLFNEHFYWNMIKNVVLSYQNRQLRVPESTLRLWFWEEVDLDYFQCPYRNHLGLLDNELEREQDYLLPGMRCPSAEWLAQANQMQQRLRTTPFADELVSGYVSLLESQYGKDNEMVVNFYFEMMTLSIGLIDPLAKLNNVKRYAEELMRILGTNPKNKLIYCEAVSSLSDIYFGIYNSNPQNQQLRSHLFSTLTRLYSRIEQYVPKYFFLSFLTVIHLRMYQLYSDQKNKLAAIRHLTQLTLELQKYKDIGCFDIRQLIIKVLLDHQLYRKAVNQLQTAHQIGAEPAFQNLEGQVKAKLRGMTESINSALVSANSVEPQVIQMFADLVERLDLGNAAELVPVLQFKKNWLEQRRSEQMS